MSKSFVVVFEDAGLFYPLGWDSDCEGALCQSLHQVAEFFSKSDARRAIDVTVKFSALRRAQGRVSHDFHRVPRSCLRVLPLVPKKVSQPI